MTMTMTKTKTNTKTNIFRECPQRAPLETCDLLLSPIPQESHYHCNSNQLRYFTQNIWRTVPLSTSPGHPCIFLPACVSSNSCTVASYAHLTHCTLQLADCRLQIAQLLPLHTLPLMRRLDFLSSFSSPPFPWSTEPKSCPRSRRSFSFGASKNWTRTSFGPLSSSQI